MLAAAVLIAGAACAQDNFPSKPVRILVGYPPGSGSDVLAPRKLQRLPLAHPPFHAIAVKASITFTMGGLQIDNHGRVVRRTASSSVLAPVPPERALDASDAQVKRIGVEYRQTVIEGLYAAGCDVGNISHCEYAGGLAPALVTGRVAGRNAGAFVKSTVG